MSSINFDSTENLAEELIAVGLSQGALSAQDIARLGALDETDEKSMKEFLRQLWSLNIEIIPPEWKVTNADSAQKAAKNIRNSCADEQAVQTGAEDPIALYLTELGSIPVLTGSDDRELIYAVEQQLASDGTEGKADEIKAELIERSLYLSAALASKYMGKGVLFLDLVQEGNMALMQLAEDFDYSDNISFTAMAVYRLDQLMRELTANRDDTVSVPQELAEDMARINAETERVKIEIGRKPTAAELSAALKIPVEKVEKIIATQKGMKDAAAYDQTGTSASGDSVFTAEAEDVLKNQVSELLAALPETEAAVIAMRYGIGQSRPLTVAETAQKLGITEQETSAAEERAMKLLGT